ncbi:DUF4167 domain-containing protein [Commensalibacter oyaizuii]|uniref:DUF4167 domain-containing protein n=1 Tax=Commensalibacter oyaizuii TaxID=3043873 RepID=A0ABT6Q111_9PROT|nr:DUF4167 domain-containing protein [Commensalibacter sp. TBRC 16381]MDI2090800.1 DUF4167 domain-containing protein [Commensalibacter sp. TBRC 16381]
MNTKRMRSRYHRSGNGGSRHQNGQVSFNRNHVFDSNGPDVRLRGTAQQLHEKYLQHGRDALSSGDRVAAESFFQYAEHYSRILNMMNQSAQQRHRSSQPSNNNPNYVENTSDAVRDSQPEDNNEVATPEVKVEPEVTEQPEVVVAAQQDEVQKPAPVRPARRGRPARSTTVKKKEPEENK